MTRPIYYYNTIKNVIVAFATIFDDVHYIADHGDTIHVPIGYAPKSKFVEFYNSEPSFDTYDARFTLPRMAFELSSMNFAPERWHNPLSRMVGTNPQQFMYARVPYDFNFNLYLATKGFEDSLKIVEQIVPYFTPELTVTIKDKVDFDLRTDIPIVLNSIGYEVVYEGSFEDKRTIEWTMGFTAKGFLYSDVKTSELIKESIINLEQDDIDRKYAQMDDWVEPRAANKNDPHEIKSTVNEDPETWK